MEASLRNSCVRLICFTSSSATRFEARRASVRQLWAATEVGLSSTMRFVSERDCALLEDRGAEALMQPYTITPHTNMLTPAIAARFDAIGEKYRHGEI